MIIKVSDNVITRQCHKDGLRGEDTSDLIIRDFVSTLV